MILITGAGGNVGKEVLKQIAQTEVRVRAAFQSVGKATTVPAGVEIVAMDYNQPETVRAALQDVERVFLLGPPTANLLAERECGQWRCHPFAGSPRPEVPRPVDRGFGCSHHHVEHGP